MLSAPVPESSYLSALLREGIRGQRVEMADIDVAMVQVRWGAKQFGLRELGASLAIHVAAAHVGQVAHGRA
jgi:hypothetical protein